MDFIPEIFGALEVGFEEGFGEHENEYLKIKLKNLYGGIQPLIHAN